MNIAQEKLKNFLNSGPDWILSSELIEMLGVTEKTLKEQRSRGRYRFRPYRIGRHVFYKRSEILEELEGPEESDED